MSPEVVGLLGILLALIVIGLGVPIAFAFLLAGMVGMWYLSGIVPSLSMLASVPFYWSTSVNLMAIPLYVLMGLWSAHSGLSRGLFDAANKWFGKLPGGLAISSIFACAGFGACTGSATATAATIGAISIPEMERYGYDSRLSLGAIVAAGGLGIMIPPSIAFIVYGLVTEVSIGKLYMAGILPGILTAAVLCALVVVWVKINPKLTSRYPGNFTMRERFVALRGILPILLLFALVMGGIFYGFFTATEAGAVGALGALLISVVIQRQLSWKSVWSSLHATGSVTCMIFLIIVGVMLFGNFLTASGLPQTAVGYIGGLQLNRYIILGAVLLLYLPLGMIMDAVGMMALTLPLVFPVITNLGFDGIWFGVLMIKMCEIGNITPPVGMNCFVIAGVAKKPLEQVFRGVWIFTAFEVVVLLTLILFPQISLYLVHLMS